MRRSKALRLLALTLVLGLSSVACNQGGGYGDDPTVGGEKDSKGSDPYNEYGDSGKKSGAQTAVEGDTVEIQGYAFKTAILKAPAGTTVTWDNKDNDKHSVTSGSPGSADGKFDFDIEAKSKGTHKFDTAGSFKYFCKYHTNMTGTIEVA